MAPDGFPVDILAMRVSADVHFTLSLPLQNPYGGYMPSYLPPPLAYIWVAGYIFKAAIHCSNNLFPLNQRLEKCHTHHHVWLLLNYDVIEMTYGSR